MAITLEKFIEMTNAEEVGGNVIVGVMADRKVVGKVESGVFNLNDDGKALVAELEEKAEGKKSAAAKKEAAKDADKDAA